MSMQRTPESVIYRIVRDSDNRAGMLRGRGSFVH